jgi:hypothetical protein
VNQTQLDEMREKINILRDLESTLKQLGIPEYKTSAIRYAVKELNYVYCTSNIELK